MSNYVVSSGVTSSLILEEGDRLTILSGGVSHHSLVGAGALEYAASGGESLSDRVMSGGELHAGSSSIIDDLLVFRGAVVLGGGTLTGTSVDHGRMIGQHIDGELRVDGVAGRQRIDSSGGLVVLAAGQVRRTDVAYGGHLNVNSGGRADASLLHSGAVEAVLSGGRTLSDTVMSGAVMHLAAGAVARAVAVAQGGTISGLGLLQGASFNYGGLVGVGVGGQTENYGSVSRTSILAHAEIDNRAGATAVGVSVESGGQIDALSGSLDLRTQVLSGGREVLLSGAVASASRVHADGLIYVAAGASANGVIVSKGGAAVVAGIVSASQTFSDPTAVNGRRVVFDGLTVQQSGHLILDGTLVLSGGRINLHAGSVIDGIVVSSGGLLVGPGEVSDKGYQKTTSDFGLIRRVVLGDVSRTVGGELVVFAGGTAQDVQLAAGTLIVSSGGEADRTVVEGLRNVLQVAGGGIVRGTVLDRGRGSYGAHEQDAGTAISTTIGSGGVEDVEGGGKAAHAHVQSGGRQVVQAGAVALETLVDHGGTVLVDGAGSAAGTTITADGKLQVASGGTAANTRVGDGGLMIVARGSVERGLTVSSAGVVTGGGVLSGIVHDAGFIADVTIASGAHVTVSSGASESAGLITGSVTIQAGGVVTNIRTRAATHIVDDGVVIFSDQEHHELSGTGRGNGVIEKSGSGSLTLFSNLRAFTGQVLLSAGSIVLDSQEPQGAYTIEMSGQDSERVYVSARDRPANGGRLQVTLSDFDSTSKVLDLDGLDFQAGAMATVYDSILSLHDGSYSARIKLSGQMSESYVVSSDGAGGTMISAAPTNADALIAASASSAWSGLALSEMSPHSPVPPRLHQEPVFVGADLRRS